MTYDHLHLLLFYGGGEGIRQTLSHFKIAATGRRRDG
jgi:hypothetical protein